MAQTITYNELIQFQVLYTTTSGGTVFSGNLYNTTAFNYFSNTTVVNDAIYFGFNSPGLYFGDITFTVGTAMVAVGKTLVWEKWNGAAWVAQTVTDNTNGFTTLGVNTVTFTLSGAASSGLVLNGISDAIWLRCRISALTSITNGGANATTVVKCKSLAIILANPGATTAGFCAALQAADTAGGWGVVTSVGSAYKINAHLFLGYPTDASPTNISDTKKYIEINGLFWCRKAGGYITLGTLVSDTDRTSRDGCTVTGARTLENYYADGSSSERWVLYSSTLNYIPFQLVKSYNSIINASSFHGSYDGTNGPIIVNTQYQIARPDYTGYTQMPNTYINGITVSGATNALRFDFSDYVKGLVNLGCTYLGDCVLTQTSNTVLINPITSTFNLNWGAGANYGNVVSVKYETSFKLKDSVGTAIQNVNIAGVNAAGYPALYVENGRSTTGSLTSGATSIGVNTNNYSINDFVSIGAEVVKITSGTYPTYTISRGMNGTTALAHQNTGGVGRQVLRNYLVDSTDSNGASKLYLIEGAILEHGTGTAPGTTINTTKNPNTFTFKKYGYLASTVVMTITSPVLNTGIVLQADPYIVASSATAGAYTGITIVANTSITITGTRTIQELYDYCQWWTAQAANMTYTNPLTTTDGINFTIGSGYTIIVNGGSLVQITKKIVGTISVSSSGYYEDSSGAKWDVSGTTYYASALVHTVNGGASHIQYANVAYYSGSTNLTYNTSRNSVSTLITDINGQCRGYAVWKIGSTDYSSQNLNTKAYSYQSSTIPKVGNGTAITDTIQLSSDAYVVVSSATSGTYAGIAIIANTSITITSNHSIQELYDYCQWWAAQASNFTYINPLTTIDGINFNVGIGYTIIIQGGSLSQVAKKINGTISVTSSGYFEDISGAKWDVSGITYYASALSHIVNHGSTHIQGANIAYYSGSTNLTYNISRNNVSTLVTDVNGQCRGYAVWKIGSTDYSSQNLNTKAYSYQSSIIPKILNGSAITDSIQLASDQYTIATSLISSAYTGIDIIANTSITITSNHSIQELYDYCQWWATQASNFTYVNPLTTTNGSTYTLNYDLILNGGNITGTGLISMPGNILTIVSGTTTLPITHNAGIYTSIDLAGIVSGSRVQVYNTTSEIELYNGIVNSTSLTLPLNWTSNQSIRLRATFCNATTAYLHYSTTGIFTNNGLNFLLNQQIDAIYASNGIDGSTVTEYTADYANIQIDVSDSDGTTTVQRMYAWYCYATTTALGIANYFGAATAEDPYNYRINTAIIGLQLQNTSTLPCIIKGARLYRDDDATILAIGAAPIQLDPGKAYIANSEGLLTTNKFIALSL